MAWKTPNRPTYEVSQAFNDKPVTILRVTDKAPNGYMPQPDFLPIGVFPTANRTVGVQRYYAARQAQVNIEKVIRIPNPGNVEITTRDVARFDGEERLYRIDQVQEVAVYPPCLDLTLVNYDTGEERIVNALV